jgi:hypothetical protein
MSTVMNAVKKPAFWLSYDKNKLFACSHCGGYALAKTCNCPKCKRTMSNAGGAKK